jgi:hypothetical protein
MTLCLDFLLLRSLRSLRLTHPFPRPKTPDPIRLHSLSLGTLDSTISTDWLTSARRLDATAGMETRDIFMLLLGLLIYSGPFVPLVATLFFRRASHVHFRRNGWALVILGGIQALSFLPYVVAVTTEQSDSLYRLFLPFGLGVLMFIGTSVYALCECVHLRSINHSSQTAQSPKD